MEEKEPDVYLKDVEKTYNSLSVLLDRSGSWGSARRMHLNAEKTRWKRMVRHPGLFLADTIKKDAARSQDVLEKTFPMIHDIDPQKTKKPTPDNLSGVGF